MVNAIPDEDNFDMDEPKAIAEAEKAAAEMHKDTDKKGSDA
jgi:hypothetical protein